MGRGLLAAVFLLALMLAGCVSQPPVPDTVQDLRWETHSRKVAGLINWGLTGRMSVQLEQEGWSANLYWRQDNGRYNLRIVAPLGRGTVEISGDGEAVRLTTPENQVLEDADVTALMQANLGWEVPVPSLVYWIRGLPDPALEPGLLEMDDSGHLAMLRQLNWEIRYERYAERGDYVLPSRISLQRTGLKFRLNISRWETGP
jgi:outer membrane lipoprotein LolB